MTQRQTKPPQMLAGYTAHPPKRGIQMTHRTLWLLAAMIAGFAISGCGEDESLNQVFWNECSSDTDCANGARCLASNGGQRVCVVVDNFDSSVGGFDGEVFDPTGLKICGDTQGAQFCAEGEFCCEGVCTTIRTDNNNCGACGNVCADSQICQDSSCVCGVGGPECAADQFCCDVSGALTCVDLYSDKDNCGGCGEVCAGGEANESCLEGQCGCLKREDGRQSLELCASGESCCPARVGVDPVTGQPYDPNEARGCVDLNTVDDCGACGNKCGDGEQCINGQCTCGQLKPQSADGLGPVCGETEACCFSPNGQQICRPEADCKCGGTLNPVTGEIEGGTTCLGVQICCFTDDVGLPVGLQPACVDPTKDAENCGGCLIPEQDATPNLAFRCDPGQICVRNFEYSLGRPPEEQNAEGIYIGQCALTCPLSRVQCPGGLDDQGTPDPSDDIPYTQEQQSCIDPLSSTDFCGAFPRRDDASTAGQCSVQNPTTFGELRNFQGVRCDGNQICRAKSLCANPEPFPGTDENGQPCDPSTHYYFEVAIGSDADFPPSSPLSASAVFDPTDPDYIQNPYLTAVCTTP